MLKNIGFLRFLLYPNKCFYESICFVGGDSFLNDMLVAFFLSASLL